jgi:hypothetical protein
MPLPDEAELRVEMEIICERMLKAGWLEAFGVHDTTGRFVVRWTAKGLERARWVNLIGDELKLGPESMRMLLVICHEHAPHE